LIEAIHAAQPIVDDLIPVLMKNEKQLRHLFIGHNVLGVVFAPLLHVLSSNAEHQGAGLGLRRTTQVAGGGLTVRWGTHFKFLSHNSLPLGNGFSPGYAEVGEPTTNCVVNDELASSDVLED
jgi:hypothetical protein